MKQSFILIPALLASALAFEGCSSLKSLTVSPAAGSVTLTAAGQTAQFRAVGTYQMGSAPTTTGDATKSVSWSSSTPSVATIDQNGLATAVASGKTAITASSDGMTATSDVTVNIAVGTTPDTVLTVIPSAGLAVSTHLGDTTQFVAYGNTSGGGALQDLSQKATWISSSASVATISSSGLATAKGLGKTVITAAFNGKTVTTDLTVLTSGNLDPVLTIIPATSDNPKAARAGETVQFLAIGALGGSPNLQDLTNQVRWVSSDTSVATINNAGLATAASVQNSSDTTVITAIATTVSGSTLTQSSTLTVTPTTGTVTLPTLALYKVGSGSGTVTSSPAGITCGPQATCTGNFPLGSAVTLTAVPDGTSTFGGWSSNCTPALPNSPSAPNTSCTVVISNGTSVGAIFNK